MTQPGSTLFSLDDTLGITSSRAVSDAHISTTQPHSALVERFIPPGARLTDSVVRNRIQA